MNKSEFGVQFTYPTKALQKKILSLNQKNNLEKLGNLIFILSDLANQKSIRLLSSENTTYLSSLNDSKVINNVYKYVAENFQKEISFDFAASVANMQRAAFCRYFKRKTKKKFTEFVNETRIMHAQKVLSETDKTVLEVAFECGYENTSYFNRQFRIYCNASPTAFREQFKQ